MEAEDPYSKKCQSEMCCANFMTEIKTKRLEGISLQLPFEKNPDSRKKYRIPESVQTFDFKSK